MLNPAEDEAVDQGGLDAAVTGPVRDEDKVCTDLVACFAHTQEKQIENRIPVGRVLNASEKTLHGIRVEMKTAQ